MVNHYLPQQEPILPLPNHHSQLQPKISTTTTYFRKVKFYQVPLKMKPDGAGGGRDKEKKQKKFSYLYDKHIKI